MGSDVSEKYKGLVLISTRELLDRLKDCLLNTTERERLFSEFHNRFKKRLYRRCCEIAYNNHHDKDLAKTLFQETMIKACNAIRKFKADDLWTEEELKNKVIGWLGVILNNEFKNLCRLKKKQIQISELDHSFDEFEAEYDKVYEDEEKPNFSFIRAKFQNILSTLSDRERYILVMCANHDCLFSNNHLPDDVVEDICKQFNIKSSYIRLIKMRALKKFNPS